MEVWAVARAIEGEVGSHYLGLARPTAGQHQFEAFAIPLDGAHAPPQHHCSSVIELCLHARMHFEWQAMAVRIPQGPDMTQETRLFLDRQSLPEVLQRAAKPVDDRLPRRTISLCRGAGDGDGRGESGHALGAGKSDLLRHDALRSVRTRQLTPPRD